MYEYTWYTQEEPLVELRSQIRNSDVHTPRPGIFRGEEDPLVMSGQCEICDLDSKLSLDQKCVSGIWIQKSASGSRNAKLSSPAIFRDGQSAQASVHPVPLSHGSTRYKCFVHKERCSPANAWLSQTHAQEFSRKK